MKRSAKKKAYLAAQLGDKATGILESKLWGKEHRARVRGKHCREWMSTLARRGARTTNAKRKTAVAA